MVKLIKEYKAELIISAIFMFYALGFNIYRVQGDGFIYYAFLEKILGVHNAEISSKTLESMFFLQSGCAFFNAPFYLLAYLVENIFNKYWNFNGITLRQISINLASNFYLLLSIILSVRILKKLNFRNILLPVISILFSTSAASVAVIMPSGNHAVDIFVNTVFVYLFTSNQNKQPHRSIWLGLVIVIAILVRYFNFVLLISIIGYYLFLKEYRKIKFILIGFFSTVWIIPLLFFVHNGTISPFYHTALSASDVLSGTVGLFPRYTLKLLIHPLHGLFIWSPVTIFSFLGLLFFPKEKARLGYLFFVIVALLLLMYGYASDWYAGWSFSNRYLVSLFPIYIIGLAAFLEKYGRKMRFLVILMTTYSIILYLNWQLCIMNGEFGTPWNMIEAWLRGESDTSFDKKVNLKVFLYRLYESCRYKYFINY